MVVSKQRYQGLLHGLNRSPLSPMSHEPRKQGLETRQGEGVGSDMGQATLHVTSGPSAGRTFRLDKQIVTVGRSPTSDILLPDERVSGNHAIVKLTPAGLQVHDLHSTNGTYVNDTAIDSARLRDGDRLRLGNTELLFVLEGTYAHDVAVRGSQPARAVAPAQRRQAQSPYIGIADEHVDVAIRAAAATRSYTGAAVGTLLLYYFGFWLLGLVANVAYLNAAGRDERISGYPPSGKGCPWALLITHGILPIAIALFVVMTMGATIQSILIGGF